jgi:hypothetical protein
MPKSVTKGRMLMHNHVRHTIDQVSGANGFRAWTDVKPPPGFKQCRCGWSGLTHYSRNPHYKCEQSYDHAATEQELNQRVQARQAAHKRIA